MDELSPNDVFDGSGPIDRLLQELDTNFPPVNPQPTNQLSEIMYRAGQRSIIEYIKQLTD